MLGGEPCVGVRRLYVTRDKLERVIAREPGRASLTSVQRGGHLAARLAGERVLDAELVEDRDDDAADALGVAVLRREQRDELVEAVLELAVVERGERVGDLGRRVLLELDAGGEAVGAEVAGRVRDELAARPRCRRAR